MWTLIVSECRRRYSETQLSKSNSFPLQVCINITRTWNFDGYVEAEYISKHFVFSVKIFLTYNIYIH